MLAADSSPAAPAADLTIRPAATLRRRALVSSPEWWLIGGFVLATVPMLRMARLVVSGVDVQYADYWLMLPEVLSPGGGLRVDGLFTFSNDHAVVIPKFLYWLNVHVGNGSNITLGLYVMAVAAAQVVIVWTVLRRTPLSEAARAGVLVLASALIFNRIGAWNFLKAMSGTAWLTANTLAILAVAMRARGRLWVSLVIGVLASMSYGTGLAVWPALVVTGLAVDRSTTNRRITMAVAAVTACAYLAMRSTSEDRSQTISGPIQLVRFTAEAIGGALVPFDSPNAEWIGFMVVGVAIAATLVVLRSGQERAAAPWIGFTVFGISAAATVAIGRSHSIFGVGSNRHASLGSITILGVVGLAAVAIREVLQRRSRSTTGRAVPRIGAAVVLLALIGAFTVSPTRDLDEVRSTEVRQDRFAIELLFGLASGTSAQLGFLGTIPAGIEQLLERNGHVPFDGHHRFDCGLAGERIDVGGLDRELPQGVELMRQRYVREIENTRQSFGWIHDPDGRIECIIIADPSGVVVGAGTIGAASDGYGRPVGGSGRPLPDGWSDGYVTVRPAEVIDATLFVVLDDGRMVLIWSPHEGRPDDHPPTAV